MSTTTLVRPAEELRSFYASHPEMAPRVPDLILAAGRDRYAPAYATSRVDWARIAVPDARGREIAAAYDALPTFDARALPHYRRFRAELGEQFSFLLSLGIRVEVSASDPYENYAAMRADVARGRLVVWSTRSTGGHPFLTDAENDRFRAVHDAFGHCATGRAFDRHGEDAAWLSHALMFSPLARRAMTTETRGQNSAMNYGADAGSFPAERIALLPARFSAVRS